MKGSYILLIKLENNQKIKISKLGNILFKKGFYIYIGSALNGLEQRINRHFKINKKLHWHIDYLLQFGKIIDSFYKESNLKEECNIAKKAEEKLFFIPGFGCSDCACRSHLFYGDMKKIKDILDYSYFSHFNSYS
jgi:Uri superfamily endonuclease